MSAHPKGEGPLSRGRLAVSLYFVRAHRLVFNRSKNELTRSLLREISPSFVCNFGNGDRHRRTMIGTESSISPQASNHPEEELSALPIWTVTLGVFALLTFGLTAVPSIICGHLALGKTRGKPRRSFERTVTTAGLAIGYLGAAVLGVWIAFLVGRLLL